MVGRVTVEGRDVGRVYRLLLVPEELSGRTVGWALDGRVTEGRVTVGRVVPEGLLMPGGFGRVVVPGRVVVQGRTAEPGVVPGRTELPVLGRVTGRVLLVPGR